MSFEDFKELVASRPAYAKAFSGPIAKSTSYDRLRHHMVIDLGCDQWAVDVVEHAEAGDLVGLTLLAFEINEAQAN